MQRPPTGDEHRPEHEDAEIPAQRRPETVADVVHPEQLVVDDPPALRAYRRFC